MISLIVTVVIGLAIGWAAGLFDRKRPRKPKSKYAKTGASRQDYCPSCGKPAQYVLGWPHCSDGACDAWGGAFWSQDAAMKPSVRASIESMQRCSRENMKNEIEEAIERHIQEHHTNKFRQL